MTPHSIRTAGAIALLAAALALGACTRGIFVPAAGHATPTPTASASV